MKKICNLKFIGDIFVIIIIILAIFVTLFTIITNKDGISNLKGYSPFSIQSNSMFPTLKKGDMIITYNKINYQDLKVNDIISFYSFENGSNIIKTHRITNIYLENNVRLYETKGDNNDVSDNVYITDVDIIGKMKYRIPFLGGIIDFLKNKWVFLFFIVIPLGIIFIYQLIDFLKILIDYRLEKDEQKEKEVKVEI